MAPVGPLIAMSALLTEIGFTALLKVRTMGAFTWISVEAAAGLTETTVGGELSATPDGLVVKVLVKGATGRPCVSVRLTTVTVYAVLGVNKLPGVKVS